MTQPRSRDSYWACLYQMLLRRYLRMPPLNVVDSAGAILTVLGISCHQLLILAYVWIVDIVCADKT